MTHSEDIMRIYDKNYIKNIENQFPLEKILGKGILNQCQLHTFKRGETFLHRGDKLQFLYFLLKGKAKTVYVSKNGNNSLQSFLTPFDIIGEIEFMELDRILNDVSAIEGVECLLIPIDQCREQLFQQIPFLQFISKKLAHKLKHSNQNSSISLNYPVENRLASYISANENSAFFCENLRDTAEMIGCSYRQLLRTLKKLCETKELHKIKKGVYQICDKRALQKHGEDIYRL